MKKFLFIDTNIFIECSFLEIEDWDRIQSLEKLITILSNDNYLLLPEVTKLEIFQRLETKKDEITSKIDKIKWETKEYNWVWLKIWRDINEKITEVLNERIENYEKVKTKIEEIFWNENVIHITLTWNHIAEAYKFFLTKRKPFTEKNIWKDAKFPPSIQSDCLNIIALNEYLNTESSYEFYFCSRDSDFLDNTDKTKLHTDITSYIKVTEFNKNLWTLLKNHFWITFSTEDIQKFDDLWWLFNDLFWERNNQNINTYSDSKSQQSNLIGETNKTIK